MTFVTVDYEKINIYNLGCFYPPLVSDKLLPMNMMGEYIQGAQCQQIQQLISPKKSPNFLILKEAVEENVAESVVEKIPSEENYK